MFLLTKYRELKNGAYDLPGMPWKDALLIAWAHDCIGLKIKLGGEWPMVTGGAPWVKHPTDFRNSATAVSARGVGGVKVDPPTGADTRTSMLLPVRVVLAKPPPVAFG